jgi:DNA-directed RNA polymerase II subunit RPB1
MDTVLKILRCTCFMCSRIVCTEDELAVAVQEPCLSRLNAVYGAARTKRRCAHCQAPRPTYTRIGTYIRTEWAADAAWESPEEMAVCTAPFTQRDALSILRSVPKDHLIVMGFDPETSHPADMILTVLLVPSPNVRPTITM